MSRKRPNIIFLMTDQQRWDALGCVNPLIQTPNLDALAAEGVRFDQAICNAPMCIPSRYSMMTGLTASQCGVRHNTAICATDEELPWPVMAQRLADLGYQTAGFGKTHWYLGTRLSGQIETEPSLRGFEYRASARPVDPAYNEGPGEILMERDTPEAFERMAAESAGFGPGGENVEGYIGLTSELAVEQTREGWLTEQCLDFLANGRDPQRPLMLYLSFDFPHPGFNCPPQYEALYDIDAIPDAPLPDGYGRKDGGDRHVGRDRRADAWDALTPLERRRGTLRYYGLCSFVDDLFGKVLARLREAGELDDALIVFVSDHGEMLGSGGHRFSKYCLYDPSVRVPVILSGSRVPEALRGTVDDRPAELIDILPTLLDVAGQGAEAEMPGSSLLGPPCRVGAFCEMHGSGYAEVEQAPALLWRTRQWALILSMDGTMADAELRIDQARGELYNLVDDPDQWHNLWDEPDCRDRREAMTRQLLMHLACLWSRYPRSSSRCRLEHPRRD